MSSESQSVCEGNMNEPEGGTMNQEIVKENSGVARSCGEY